MLRMTPLENAGQAESYYAKSDGGYYLDADGLHREWGGKGAALLGLSGPPDYEQVKRLIHGLDPHSGEQLTAKLIEEPHPGLGRDRERPQGRDHGAGARRHAHPRRAMGSRCEAMADLEQYTTTRVRKGGQQDDRVTGNLVWYATEHAETRPAKEDGMPDWDRHIHFVVLNLTKDETEGEWKAVKFRPIMELRKYLDRRFDSRLSAKLVGLGYEIETSWQPDRRGGRKYHSWDIHGIPQEVIDRFSRRSKEIHELEAASCRTSGGRTRAPRTD